MPMKTISKFPSFVELEFLALQPIGKKLDAIDLTKTGGKHGLSPSFFHRPRSQMCQILNKLIKNVKLLGPSHCHKKKQNSRSGSRLHENHPKNVQYFSLSHYFGYTAKNLKSAFICPVRTLQQVPQKRSTRIDMESKCIE